MTFSILTIGDEILIGKITNTNASYIAKELNILGLTCVEQTSVGDSEKDVVDALNRLCPKSDYVIITGGLGLTDDDITKEVVSKYCGLNLRESSAAKQRLTEYYNERKVKIDNTLLNFDLMPENCVELPNTTGVAFGFIINRGKTKIAVFPGPPSEMRPMFRSYFLPTIKVKDDVITKYVKIFGVRELEVMQRVNSLDLDKSVLITSYCTLSEVALVLRYKSSLDAKIIDDVLVKLSKEFGKSLSTFSNMELENVVYTILQGKNKKIAVGESITGGKIAEKLVSVPGISAFFNEGAVCYTNASKISRLFVLPETLGKFGAVSEQTAREMCEGLLTNPMNDIAISTTGYAGPKSKNGKETVGKCFIGIGTKGNIKVFEHVFHGDRNTVRETCAKYALFYLINLLKYNEL